MFTLTITKTMKWRKAIILPLGLSFLYFQIFGEVAGKKMLEEFIRRKLVKIHLLCHNGTVT
jgi:hypothetical protein